MELDNIFRGDVEVPKPELYKTTRKWQDVEEEKAEYFKVASTQEIAVELLDKMRRVQVVADRSKNLKETTVNLIKDITATIIGALIELTKRASGIDTDAKLTELAKEIRKLRKDNKCSK